MAKVIPIRFSDKLLDKFGDVLANWWDTRWNKTTVYYSTGNLEMNDPRDLLRADFVPTPLVIAFLDSIKNKTLDEKAYMIHKWILRTFGFKYKTDRVVWNKSEYWQTPQETLALVTGDCEDASLLWMKLTELAGIPSYRCKVYCGDTDAGGHAYPCYLTVRGNRWVSMDLTYYANVLQVKHRADVQNISYYGRVWFTFNRSTIWAQHDTTIKHKW